MSELIGQYLKKYEGKMYGTFRIIIGILFLMHGISKMVQVSAGKLALGSLIGVAGIVEILVGAALIIGLLTRLASLGGIITMLVALIKVHLPQGINPLTNGGELALLYLIAFLLILFKGAGECSLDTKVLKKKIF